MCGFMQCDLDLAKGTAADGLANLIGPKALTTFVVRGLHLQKNV